jgi:hypothetical protein
VSEDDSPRKIKVVDRRWFTDDGELRQDRPVERTPTVPETAPPARPQAGAPEAAADAPSSPADAPVTNPAFLELVATLAQQAELFLIGAEGFPKQPEQAKRLIDYLGVLEVKTRGNLSAEESQLLSSIVFQLRTVYVQSRG